MACLLLGSISSPASTGQRVRFLSVQVTTRSCRLLIRATLSITTTLTGRRPSQWGQTSRPGASPTAGHGSAKVPASTRQSPQRARKRLILNELAQPYRGAKGRYAIDWSIRSLVGVHPGIAGLRASAMRFRAHAWKSCFLVAGGLCGDPKPEANTFNRYQSETCADQHGSSGIDVPRPLRPQTRARITSLTGIGVLPYDQFRLYLSERITFVVGPNGAGKPRPGKMTLLCPDERDVPERSQRTASTSQMTRRVQLSVYPKISQLLGIVRVAGHDAAEHDRHGLGVLPVLTLQLLSHLAGCATGVREQPTADLLVGGVQIDADHVAVPHRPPPPVPGSGTRPTPASTRPSRRRHTGSHCHALHVCASPTPGPTMSRAPKNDPTSAREWLYHSAAV